MTMRVLALIVLLAGCGDMQAAPQGVDLARTVDLSEPYVGDDSQPDGGDVPQGGGYDPCQYAICNNPDDRVKYSDPVPFLPTLPVSPTP
jgi:hypothetical protein